MLNMKHCLLLILIYTETETKTSHISQTIVSILITYSQKFAELASKQAYRTVFYKHFRIVHILP